MMTEKVKHPKGQREKEVKDVLVEVIERALSKTDKTAHDRILKSIRKASADLAKKFVKAIKKEEKKAAKKAAKDQKSIKIPKKASKLLKKVPVEAV